MGAGGLCDNPGLIQAIGSQWLEGEEQVGGLTHPEQTTKHSDSTLIKGGITSTGSSQHVSDKTWRAENAVYFVSSIA